MCLDIVDDGWQDWSGMASGNNLGKEVGSAVEQWRDLAGSAVCTVRSLGERPEAFLLTGPLTLNQCRCGRVSDGKQGSAVWSGEALEA